MKKIAITGANGYIASLIQEANRDVYEFIPIIRATVALDDPKRVYEYFKHLDFDIVVHTAASTATKDCEEKPELTHAINTQSVIAICNACHEKGKRFIFFGSEQSFNGCTKKGPFHEDDERIAITNYGKQKSEADDYIQQHASDYVILRLSWMMGLSKPGIKASPNIIGNVMQAILQDKPTKFTVHEVRGMTYAKPLASQFKKIVELPSGVYHFSNVNTLSTYDSARSIAKKLNLSEANINRLILPDHERYADRFRDYRLDNTKIKRFGIALNTFEEDVEECLNDFGWMK